MTATDATTGDNADRPKDVRQPRLAAIKQRAHHGQRNGRRSVMSDELAKVLRRFEERLVHLETSAQQGLSHWKRFHLHNALNALQDDHSAASLHLDEFDRAELAKEFPEMEADKVPTVEEIRTRFDMIAGGAL
jgi:hypothetical protein